MKPLAEFNRSTEFGYQFFCRACQSEWYRENRSDHIANVKANSQRYQQRNREFVLRYLSAHPCVDCGETDPVVLEFDHIANKVTEVSRLVQFGTIERLRAEIEKCEVRCANCHMRRTAEQFGWRKGRDFAIANMLQVRN